MRIEVEHVDGGSREENERRSDGVTRIGIVVEASACSRGRVHLGRYCLDENHAQALVLALQAAIAEVQARAVSL